MYSILGRGSFCFNYCLNSARHGGDQFVALLRWYGSPGFFDSGLQLICIFWSLVSHFPLDNTSIAGEFAGQSNRSTPWSFNQLLVLWQCGQVSNPAGNEITSLKSWSAEGSMNCLQHFLVNGCSGLWFSKKHNGPTPEDDIAPQIITNCGNLTLDFKQLRLWAPPFLQTLGPWFPMKYKTYSHLKENFGPQQSSSSSP